MRDSIRQMFRTPVRTVLFIVLLTFAALLMTLGAGLYIKNEKDVAEYEQKFITIGTVSQKPESFQQVNEWDAEKKNYQIRRKAQYTSYYTTGDLLFPEAGYLAEPEQRAYYASWVPDYATTNQEGSVYDSGLVAEFSPLEDCVPGEAVQIKITKVFGGDPKMEGAVVFLCDHSNPEPKMLYQDKTYAAYIGLSYYAHGETYEKAAEESPMLASGTVEYIPYSIASSIYRTDGSRIEDSFGDDAPIFEVTEGFYETPEGKRLLNLAETMGYFYHTQPITGTNETCLLMPFYNGDSYLIEGRDITAEEYDQGINVCLAPRRFMEDNQLSLGDKITTRLFYTNTRWNAGQDFLLYGGGAVWKVIDEEGNKLEPFEISEYTVVGIYDTAGSGGADMSFTSGADELIVPMKSIASGKEKNLIWAGPMADSTTSFRIPNGTIEEFQKQWAKYGTPELEFTFYDMGYTQLMAGMENMRNMSLFFLIIGVVSTALLLFFFSHLFITKQACRTAIERSLGMSGTQCGWSILSGLMFLVIAGSIVGSVCGAVLSHHISAGQTEKAYYDTTYSLGIVQAEETLATQDENSHAGNGNTGDISSARIAFTCAAGIILTGAGISVFKMNRSLSREPMELLSKMQRELS